MTMSEFKMLLLLCCSGYSSSVLNAFNHQSGPD